MALVALLMASLASAVPETAIQGAYAVAEGTDVTQTSSNTATVDGDDVLYAGDIVQVGAGTGTTTQTATNTAGVTGDDTAASAQGISQAGSGNDVTQTGSNTATVAADDAAVGQSLAQSNVAKNAAKQTGTNTAYVTGDNAMVGQSASSGAQGKTVAQLLNNRAQITGDDPVSSQLVAASAIASGAITQGAVGTPMGNTLRVNDASTGGAAAQVINAGAVGAAVTQISGNLMGNFTTVPPF